MKKKIFLSLAVIAGLFCLLAFINAGEGRTQKTEITANSNSQVQENEQMSDSDAQGQEVDEERENSKQNADYNVTSNASIKDLNADSVISSKGEMSSDSSSEASVSLNVKDLNVNEDNSSDIISSKETSYFVNTDSIEDATRYYQEDLKKLVYTVLESLSINKNTAVFDYPEVTDPYHLSVKLQAFLWNGEGDDTIFRYVSDDGWLGGNPVDNSKHTQKLNMNLDKELSAYKIVLEIKASNFDSNIIQIYDCFWNEGDDPQLATLETKINSH